jgi:CBS domain-containing protein
MKISEVMTSEVHCIAPNSTLQDAAKQMRDLDIGSLPVCQNEQLIGMITDRDITIRCTAQGKSPQEMKVQDAMTKELAFCYQDEDVEVAADLMEERQIRRLPIMDRGKKIVGIVSLGDLATRHSDEMLSGEVLQQVSQPTQQHMQ